jgi:hypothetical protein
MLIKGLYSMGLRGLHLHLASLGSIVLCLSLWIRAKTIDQEERGNAERRAIFVGLWPPMLWLIGNAIEQEEATRTRHRAAGRAWSLSRRGPSGGHRRAAPQRR